MRAIIFITSYLFISFLFACSNSDNSDNKIISHTNQDTLISTQEKKSLLEIDLSELKFNSEATFTFLNNDYIKHYYKDSLEGKFGLHSAGKDNLIVFIPNTTRKEKFIELSIQSDKNYFDKLLFINKNIDTAIAALGNDYIKFKDSYFYKVNQNEFLLTLTTKNKIVTSIKIGDYNSSTDDTSLLSYLNRFNW